MEFPKVIAVLLLVTIPSSALADDLDDVLDDLIQFHKEARVAAAADSTTDAAPGNRSTIFKPITNYQIESPTRTEDAASVEHRTTYISLNGGASFEVRVVSAITRANFVLHGKMKDTVTTYQESSRTQPVKIKGASGGFLGANDNRATAIVLALKNDSYLIIRASRLLEKKDLINFAESLGISQISEPSQA